MRAVMREPEVRRLELEEMISYFPRGKRGKLEACSPRCTGVQPGCRSAFAAHRPPDRPCACPAFCAKQVVQGDVTNVASMKQGGFRLYAPLYL